MKKTLVLLITLITSNLIFAQSLTYNNLKALLRGSKSYNDYLLTSNGFSIGYTKKVDGETVIHYFKNQQDERLTESIVIGMSLQGPDQKQHSTISYYQKSLFYMTDFARQIPSDYVLEEKASREDGIYNYESTDCHLQITMSLDPMKKPFGIFMLDNIGK